jgi:catechol 2,3-dioxygenase-like lactoylglutathione lyase family enzyme
MGASPFTQQVTFLYTRDLGAASAFLGNTLGLDLVLDQGGTCHIFRVAGNSFLGVCTNREPPAEPGVTFTFITPDVDAEYARLMALGVAFDGPPKHSERFNVYSCFFHGPGLERYRFELEAFRDPAWPAPV